MNDNLSPKAIYLQDKDDLGNNKVGVYAADITWCVDAIDENDEKYIRADLVAKQRELLGRIGLTLAFADEGWEALVAEIDEVLG